MHFERVLKFGGAGLADGPAVEHACDLIRDHGGKRPVVVVSAHQGVTELLDTVVRAAAQGLIEGDRVRIRHRTLLRQLGLDSDLLDRHFTELFVLLEGIRARGRFSPEERDLALSYGERMSARVVAHALRSRGIHATPVDAFDLGLFTDSNFGNAAPSLESLTGVKESLEEVTGVPVVTGFVGKDRAGNLTTLGRNGSDLTAALIAEAVGAGELHLWKTVGGMMTADPKLVPDARVIDRLGFDEAAEYAFHGAEILHAAALAPAKRGGVLVRVLDVNHPEAEGTLIEERSGEHGVVGIAARKRVTRLMLTIPAGGDRSVYTATFFGALADQRIECGPVRMGHDRISVLVAPSTNLERAVAALGPRARQESEFALVALIGREANHDAQVGARAQSVLADCGVEIYEAHTGSRERSQAFLVRAQDLERAVRALHGAFLRRQVSLSGAGGAERPVGARAAAARTVGTQIGE